jgi:hypothetical protein
MLDTILQKEYNQTGKRPKNGFRALDIENPNPAATYTELHFLYA